MSESGPKGQTTHIFLLFESEAKKINHQYGISCIALKEIHEGCNNLHQARTNIIWSNFSKWVINYWPLLEALWLVNYRLTYS